MPILMTGGGDSENYYELDRHFRGLFRSSDALLLIPVANEPEDYEDSFERVSEEYGKGFGTVEMCTDLGRMNADYLKQFAAIYIDGGNTFSLIEHIRATPFNQLVQDFHAAGGSVYGDSAGAIVLGREIGSAFWGEDADDNVAALQSFHGVSLLDNWSIHCHYESEDDETAQDFVYNQGSPVLAISEHTGLIIEDDKIHGKVFGSTPLAVFTFTGKKSVACGSNFSLEELLAG